MKTPVEALMDTVDWKETGATEPMEGFDGCPYATHEGVLEIAGVSLRCYRLNDGRAIFNGEDVERFFGATLAV